MRKQAGVRDGSRTGRFPARRPLLARAARRGRLRPLVIKDGNLLLFCRADGGMPVGPRHEFGLYYHDCRFLSGYELELDGTSAYELEQAGDTRSHAVIRLVASLPRTAPRFVEAPVPGAPSGTVPEPLQAHVPPPSGRPAAPGPLQPQVAAPSGQRTSSGPVEAPVPAPPLPLAAPELGVSRCRVRWHRHVDGDRLALVDDIRLENEGATELRTEVSIRFASGFEDIFTVRGRRSGRGQVRSPRLDGQDLVFGYHGRDGIDRETRIRPAPGAWTWSGTTARVELAIPAHSWTLVSVTCTVCERRAELSRTRSGRDGAREGAARRGPSVSAVRASELRRSMSAPATWAAIHTDSPRVQKILARARADLQTLRSEQSGHAYFAAGVPWFAALFGRDSLITGLQVLPFERGTSEGTLRLLAEYQGRTIDPATGEQPGKILHELRVGELARLNLVPHGPSYASIDATPLFLVLLGEHVHWTGDTALFEELRPAFDAALAWIDRYGDRNGNGFVDYLREGRAGPVNQGWKDSWDGVIDERGRLARAPIALVEVQAYVYRAWRESARLLRRSGDEARAAALEHRSVELQARVERDFWLNDSDCYALGLDHAGRPLAVVTSNPGHVLWARLAAPGHARAVARRLLAGDEFSGFGLRTLSASEHRYSPLGYHLGTVWPHDTAIAVAGLRRYGFDREADRLANGLLDAADLFPQQRLPEAFSGAPRRGHSAPRPYPEANQPQAWAAGSVLHLVHSLLGLVADAPKACLTIVRPRLPAGVGRLDLTGLVVGPDRADLHFERRGEDVLTDVGRVTGSLQVEVVDSWPEDRA